MPVDLHQQVAGKVVLKILSKRQRHGRYDQIGVGLPDAHATAFGGSTVR
jgi:hypothetical protein